jgi:hypothetical protein
MFSFATLLLAALSAAPPSAVKSAADRFAGGVDWQEQSVLEGDFSCAGRPQNAILGTAGDEVVVAVFTQGLSSPPELLRFASAAANGDAASIGLDESSLSVEEIAGLSGKEPKGYRQSGSCKGVRLDGPGPGVAHIYWDHDGRRFDSWTQ